MAYVEHTYERPHWGCRVCGLPWPCATARKDLSTEYRVYPSLLSVYTGHLMYEALGDMWTDNVTLPDLHERFLAWVPRDPEER
ncbi:hypothetical protein ACTI_10320 [Actinoplanes sp. OR16]|uniref:hypothetical protein n=1 Tax=Actinoplanes sp. OR16 TaxID=946334 RepID=UPI000F70B94B|nr:hypothetical protein [Actinoplanes sp. OR16]BBH64347.1 hypothetical protein ACTI_10320 [Actinoplanes sp. OR16]